MASSNTELVDSLKKETYIKSPEVERVFRAVDRGDYVTPEDRHQAYRSQPWKKGNLHLSAPNIYGVVMEGLQLKPGLSFLNVGSGTGYLSTMAGLMLGRDGVNHGIELYPEVVDHANNKVDQFMKKSTEFGFCKPKFYCGNGLCLMPQPQLLYDRVYCGAGCPDLYECYFKQLLQVGGYLVMPLKDQLVKVRRMTETQWSSINLLKVTFTPLRAPTLEEQLKLLRIDIPKCPSQTKPNTESTSNSNSESSTESNCKSTGELETIMNKFMTYTDERLDDLFGQNVDNHVALNHVKMLLKSSTSTEQSDLNDNYESKITELEINCQQNHKICDTKIDSVKKDLTKKYEAKIEELEQSHKNSIAKMENLLEYALKNLTEKYDAKIEALENKLKHQSTDATKHSNDEEIEKLRQRLQEYEIKFGKI